MRLATLAFLFLSGCSSMDNAARSFFGAMHAMNDGLVQSGVTQAAATGLLVPQPYVNQQQQVVTQPTAAFYPRPIVAPASTYNPPRVPYRPLSQ